MSIDCEIVHYFHTGDANDSHTFRSPCSLGHTKKLFVSKRPCALIKLWALFSAAKAR